MLVETFRSKIHRVTVTEANLNYVGSITIDEALIDAANMFVNQRVQIVNVNNGERLETYIIAGERGSGVLCLNGPAARRVEVGDTVIIIAYALMEEAEARAYEPVVIFPDANNLLVDSHP